MTESRSGNHRPHTYLAKFLIDPNAIAMATDQLPFKPVELMSTDEDSDAHYIYVQVKAPRFSGISLRMFSWILENRFIGPSLLQYLKDENLITKVFINSRYHEPPMHIPQFPVVACKETAVLQVDMNLPSCDRLASALGCLASSPHVTKHDTGGPFRHWTILDYSKAYTSGMVTPTTVAQRFLLAVNDSCKPEPGMSFFINYYDEDILKQAEESTARYAKGQHLSILDGVPIAVKDEIDCLPYPTTGGTKWLHKVRKVESDAACVKRLRDCGAILVGKSNMHELGMGTSGINPHYGATRNPYNKNKCSGGSSGGSAAIVAAGLCPAALGVDGGGSVRMPSALCGVVGFKGTFGRISSSGVLPLNWTVGMVGIHAATVEDALIMYIVIHGHLPKDHIVSNPPPVNVPLLKELGSPQGDSLISGISFAKYTKWFEDSDGPIHEKCYIALGHLQKRYECKVIEVTLPEVEEMRLAHYVTIGCECSTSLGLDYLKSGKSDSGLDARVGFSIYSSFNNREFLAAQRLRYRQMHYHMEIFKKADIIVTPTTACVAQPIQPSALKYGELNYIDGAKFMRYQIAANFLGLPAISVPVGYDTTGMPIGIQLLGRPWSEATLLRVAFVIEKLFASDLKQPDVFYNLLS